MGEAVDERLTGVRGGERRVVGRRCKTYNNIVFFCLGFCPMAITVLDKYQSRYYIVGVAVSFKYELTSYTTGVRVSFKYGPTRAASMSTQFLWLQV